MVNGSRQPGTATACQGRASDISASPGPVESNHGTTWKLRQDEPGASAWIEGNIAHGDSFHNDRPSRT